MELLGFSMTLPGEIEPIKIGNGIEKNGFITDKRVLEMWGVGHYTHLWGRDGRAVHAAAAAPPAKRQNALTCLGKAIEYRREDMKKYARSRKCRGECPESTNCRDCRMRRSHEFMLRLMRESGDAMQAL